MLNIDIGSEIIVPAIAVLFCALQLFLCLKVKKMILRLIPTVVTALSTVVLFVLATMITEGWDAIGYLILAICAGAFFCACVLAWLIYLVIWLLRRSAQKETVENEAVKGEDGSAE